MKNRTEGEKIPAECRRVSTMIGRKREKEIERRKR